MLYEVITRTIGIAVGFDAFVEAADRLECVPARQVHLVEVRVLADHPVINVERLVEVADGNVLVGECQLENPVLGIRVTQYARP